MKKVFTLVLAFAIVCFASMQAKAQINDASPFPINFVIEQPASIAATYDYGTQTEEWGPQLDRTVSGVVAWGFGESVDADGNPIPGSRDSLGCAPLTNGADLKDKMVMIRRGVCNFSLKVYHAQVAGAAGVLIANHYDDPANDAQTVVGMLGGDSLAAVTVPAVFISRATGELIVPEVDAGNEVIATFDLLNLNDHFGPYAYFTPQSQIVPLDEIQVDFFNDSPLQSVTPTVTVEITDPAGDVTTFSETQEVGALGDSTFTFPDYVPSMKGAYSIIYKNDFNTDELRHDFEITENVFGVDAGAPYGWISPGDQGFIDDGSTYDFGSTYIAGADGLATCVTFGLNNPGALFTGNPTADVFTAVIYDLDPTGAAPPTGAEDSYDSFGLLEFGGYTLTGNEAPGDLINIEFFAPVALEEGKAYLVMIQYNGNNAGIGVAPQYLTSGEINYPYFGSMVFTDRLYTGGWASNTNGVIRLGMEGFDCTNTVSTDNIALDDSKVSVFPNPTNELVNLDLKLAEVADQIEIKMVDVTAKTIRTYVHKNVKERTFNFNVSDLENGTYFLHIKTPEGMRAQKFTVLK